MGDNNNNNNNNNGVLFLNHMQMMRRGLHAVKVHTGRLRYPPALVELFKANFGLHPKHAAKIWRDLLEKSIVPAGQRNRANLGAILDINQVWIQNQAIDNISLSFHKAES